MLPTNLSFQLSTSQIAFIQSNIIANLDNLSVDMEAIHELSEEVFPDMCQYEEVLAFYSWC